MDTCDVLIAGGGPSGSACAWKLRQAGVDVIVADKAVFPRDKVCAGWVPPQALDDLRIDRDDYRRGRTFQPITGFRVGMIDGDAALETSYDHPVSFGIRRSEFDDYMLRRSGARLMLGTAVSSLRRDGAWWVINDRVRASMLVGAGGHGCPVGRLLNGASDHGPIIAAQEVEFAIDARAASSMAVAAGRPELYFNSDLSGYGWCLRKQDYLNIGFGRLAARALPKSTADFVDYLKARGRIPAQASWRWHGHAYRVSEPPCRRAVGEAALLVGDAAGLACPQSGEGIRPAIESGLIAASTILDAAGRYTIDRLSPFEDRIQERFVDHSLTRMLSRAVPARVLAALAPRLLDSSWFVRHVVLDRWFLHAREPALIPAATP